MKNTAYFVYLERFHSSGIVVLHIKK